MPLCAVRCCRITVKIATGPRGLASTNLQSLSGKVSPAHVFIHHACQTKRGEQTCSAQTEPTSTMTPQTKKERWIQHTAWRSHRTSSLLRSPPDVASEKGHPLTVWASLPPLAFLNDNPLHSTLRSYHNQLNLWPWILQVPPWHRKPRPLMRKIPPSIHISGRFLRKWKNEISSENDSFTDAASTTGRLEWVTPRELTDLVTSWADPSFSNSTVFASLLPCTSVTVSLGAVLLIIQLQIKAILQQIASLRHPPSLLESW